MIDLYQAARATGTIEPAERGRWRIERFTVGSDLRQVAQMAMGRRGVPPGEYTRLMRGGTVVMTDTPDELHDMGTVFRNGKGRVLVHGLGLGCVVRGLLAKPAVEAIDVIEIDPDVIALVVPYFANDPRVTIQQGNAYSWQPPKDARWDFGWHDVWDDLTWDNDYTGLLRRFGRRCAQQGAWGHDWLKAHKMRRGW